ncbi:MAG: MBOAT family protein [Actinobacteria bacterium]|nr:MBOAT family protein [Actinomycetota bacterium]
MQPPKGVSIQLTSYAFLFAFLPVTLLVYWLLPRGVWRLAFLVLASWVFVGWYDWRSVFIMVGATFVDWAAALLIARSSRRPPSGAPAGADGASVGDAGRRRAILVLALLANVAILGYFKYRGFFLDSLDGLGSWIGLDLDLPALKVLLPLGISFYTFSAMSYVIDVYRGDAPATRSLLRYAAFIALFPRAIAGPILRWRDVEGDFADLPRRLTTRLAALGLFFIACGMAKKLLVADVLLPRVDELFANAANLRFFSGWAAALGYSLQLYFDFSGYSDMAVGIAYLLGFHFPQNFDSPYKAANPSQFWRRWHMTLSFWLRDYVYIPLGGSRRGMSVTVRNLMLTFIVAGIWHGAGWTFIVWGLLHGLYQSVHAVARSKGMTPKSQWLNRGLTFVAVVVAWVFFRASTLEQACHVLKAMTGLNGLGSLYSAKVQIGYAFTLLIVAGLAWVNLAPNTWEIEPRPTWRYGVVFGLLLGAAVLAMGKPAEFVYVQF